MLDMVHPNMILKATMTMNVKPDKLKDCVKLGLRPTVVEVDVHE